MKVQYEDQKGRVSGDCWLMGAKKVQDLRAAVNEK
jgi:hypothetical protein